MRATSLRHGYRREALRCVLIPLDPSRYLELPWALETLGAKPGERVLDLASPKLLAVQLARRGVQVTCVDELESEIETWRALAAGVTGSSFSPPTGARFRSRTRASTTRTRSPSSSTSRATVRSARSPSSRAS